MLLLLIKKIYGDIKICCKTGPYNVRYLNICGRLADFCKTGYHFNYEEYEKYYPYKRYQICMKVKKQYSPEKIYHELSRIKLKAW